MNGMTNLPQFYQDIMRSHFVNALNQQQQMATLQAGTPQQQLQNTSPSGSSLLTTTSAQQHQQVAFFQQQQQQQMAAAVAAVQAHVQKQQHANYVNQIQAQMNAVAAAAAASAAQNSLKNTNQAHHLPVSNSNSNNPMSFQYPQKSFFMPSNLDQIKTTINSFYQQHNQHATHPGSSISKENLLLHQQDLMQQQIEQASKKHNTLARAELNKAKQIQLEQSQQNRGRGRPRRQLEARGNTPMKRSSPSPSASSTASGKANSPSSNKSRSPVREYKQQKKSHTENVTRTSTPSKFSDSLEIEQGNCEQNSIISKSELEEYEEANRDLSLYEGANQSEYIDEEEIDEDMMEHIEEEEESLDSIKDEELNTTTSTVMTSKSSRQHQASNAHSSAGMNGGHKPPNGPVYDFTMQALEMSLYGYLRQTDPMFASHAISGLRIPQFKNQMLGHGVEQQRNEFKKDNNSPSSSSNSSISNSDQSQPQQSNSHQQNNAFTKSQSSSTSSKKSNFSIENLLTTSSSPSSSSSSSTLSLQQQPFHMLNQHYQQQRLQLQNQKQRPDIEKIDLPDELQIRQTVQQDLAHYGVFCKKTVITKSTRFGPFPGKALYPNEIKPNEDNNHMWEIFNDGRLSHFIDGRHNTSSGQNQPNQKSTQISPSSSYGSNNSNSNNNGGANQWMIYVNCARFAQEQNMIAVQLDGEIFYEVCKDIAQGQELLVWYGDSYLQFLGIPVSLKDMTDEISEDTTENKDGYACDRCGKVFAYKYYRDKHLKYTRCVDQGDRKFPCHLCTRSFEKRDRLRIHILHVHEKHRPHKCSVCGKSFSQSSSLNKHMRVHSGERPYKCVYCNKAFTASSILRTHIRQHSGEKPFKCKYCGKAFASHAAHDSHVRRTHNITKDKEANLIL